MSLSRSLLLAAVASAALRASAETGAPDHPFNLPPAAGGVDFFAEAMRLPPPPQPPGPASLLTPREGRGAEAATTRGGLRPTDLEGTPASLETSHEPVEVYHFSTLADRFMAGGGAASALRLLDNAEAIAPGNPAVLERLARANEAAGDLPRALTVWSRLELLFPEDAEVRAARIRCLLLAGRAGEARTAAEAAARIPGPRRHLLCRFYLDVLRLLDPSVPPPSSASYTVRELSVLVRRIQGAQREVDALFGPESRPVALRWLLTGERAAVDSVPAEWSRQAGRAGAALWSLHTTLRDGRPEGAETALRTLDELGVKSPWLELARAEWHIVSRRPGEAARLLALLRDPATRSQPLSLRLGELWMACGDAARATELLRDAALMDRTHPDTPRSEFMLVCALCVQGQDQAALPMLRRLVRERPEHLREWLRGGSAGVKAVRESALLGPVLDAATP